MAAKIKGYELAVGEGEVGLISEVNQLIGKGWRPTGGVTAFRREDGKEILLQAMIKD